MKYCWGEYSVTGSISSMCKNLMGQHPLRAEIQSPEKIHLGGSICTTGSLLFLTKVHQVFSPNVDVVAVEEFFSDVRQAYVDPFRRYSRSKSKVVKNRAEIWTVFWPSQNLGGGPSKSCTHIITPASRHVVWKKFREDTPNGPEVIGAHTLNFRPNFKFSPLIFFWGWTPSPMGGALCSLGQSLKRVKI